MVELISPRSMDCTSHFTSQPRKASPSYAYLDRARHTELSSLTCENPTEPSATHQTVATGSQEVRGFESLRLHPKVLVTVVCGCGDSLRAGANVANCSHTAGTGVRKESSNLVTSAECQLMQGVARPGATVACEYPGRPAWVSLGASTPVTRNVAYPSSRAATGTVSR